MGGGSGATQACHQQRGLTFAALAFVQLEGEDDVFVVATELAHETLRLAQLGKIKAKVRETSFRNKRIITDLTGVTDLFSQSA